MLPTEQRMQHLNGYYYLYMFLFVMLLCTDLCFLNIKERCVNLLDYLIKSLDFFCILSPKLKNQGKRL